MHGIASISFDYFTIDESDQVKIVCEIIGARAIFFIAVWMRLFFFRPHF